jgi:adenylyl cyclase-associated protein
LHHPAALKGSTAQVKGKVNSVMMDACKKVGIVFDAVVASFEAVNCSALEIQCTGSCPCLSIDKTDGVQV